MLTPPTTTTTYSNRLSFIVIATIVLCLSTTGSLVARAQEVSCSQTLDYWQTHRCLATPFPLLTVTVADGDFDGFKGLAPYDHGLSLDGGVCVGETLPISPSCPDWPIARVLDDDTQTALNNPARMALRAIGHVLIDAAAGVTYSILDRTILLTTISSNMPVFREMSTICDLAAEDFPTSTNPEGFETIRNQVEVMLATPCASVVVCTPQHNCDDNEACTHDICYSDLTCSHEALPDGATCRIPESILDNECGSHVCLTGTCIANHAPVDTPCTSTCMQNPRCDGSGRCASDGPIDCSGAATNPCDEATCSIVTGECVVTADPGCNICLTDVDCPSVSRNCMTNRCDITTGRCVTAYMPNGMACSGADTPALTCHEDLCESGRCASRPVLSGTQCELPDQICIASAVCNTAGTCLGMSTIPCPDEEPCTRGTCSPIDGSCSYADIPGCEAICVSDDECDDVDSSCMVGRCVNNACVQEPRQCTAPDACHTTHCDLTVGCVVAPVVCSQLDACYPQTCDVATGTCNKADKSVCGNSPDACKRSVCATNRFLQPECTLEDIPGCVTEPHCTAASDCDDGNACTSDTCTAGVCQHTATVCPAPEEGGCIQHACNPTTGSCDVHPLAEGMECNDGDPCTGVGECQADASCGAGALLALPGCAATATNTTDSKLPSDTAFVTYTMGANGRPEWNFTTLGFAIIVIAVVLSIFVCAFFAFMGFKGYLRYKNRKYVSLEDTEQKEYEMDERSRTEDIDSGEILLSSSEGSIGVGIQTQAETLLARVNSSITLNDGVEDSIADVDAMLEVATDFKDVGDEDNAESGEGW